MLRVFVAFGLVLSAIAFSTAIYGEEPAKDQPAKDTGSKVLSGTFSATFGSPTFFGSPVPPFGLPAKTETGTLTLSGTNSFGGGVPVNGATALGVFGVTNGVQAGAYTVLSGTNSDSGSITVSGGTLTLVDPMLDYGFMPATATFSGANTLSGVGVIISNTVPFSPMSSPEVANYYSVAPAAAVAPAPAKASFFYIITEGAGLGDQVRRFPCTGNETVMDAVSQIGGISQVSSTKMWIARPTRDSPGKSTIMLVDWAAISKHGINTTNHKLEAGDRLVIAEDEQVKRSNLLGKKTALLERVGGVVSLITSTFNSERPAADGEVIRGLVERGYITDDDEMRRFVLDAIHLKEEANKKAAAHEKKKEPEKEKAK